MTQQILRNARIFDSISGRVGEAAVIIVDEGKISAVLPAGAPVPAGKSIDLGGRVVLPGLIDCHVHVMAVHHDVWQLSLIHI